MDFRKFPTILAILLLTVLFIQPVLSGTTVTSDNLENDEASVLFNRAELLLVDDDYENAIKLFDQALASNTTLIKKTDIHLYIYRDKAYAQIQLELYDDALATLNEGLAFYPQDAMLWNNKGYALYRTGKMQDALAAYDSAVSFDSNYTIAHINRGDTLIQMGRYPDAVAAYIRANETDPFNTAAADGLKAARKGEAESTRTMTILLAVFIVAAIGVVGWYVRFRKAGEPAPEEKRERSKK
jgi:tetratricopeptide (TPR) repeat protein